jgi:acyl-CoA thioester hydrolase
VLSLYDTGNEAAWLGQGHVSNVVYPAYLELSRLQFFEGANDPEPHDFAYQHVTAELHLRYLEACFYDEPLRVFAKLAALGRSSATMDQAIVGADGTIRTISRMIVVRSRGDATHPWTDEQRRRLEAFAPIG